VANGEGVAAQGDRRRREIVTPERWKQVEAVFEQALELPAEARQDFFHKMCNGDEELRREVDSLLQAHARAGNFIDKRSLFFSGESLEENDAAVAAGQLIGSYRIVREIGRGGMGAVYLAERADEQYEKRVAIKVIKRGMDTDSVLRHFRNERQILASFDHPNIARLFDGGTTEDGLPYFVMEYVEGVPIDKYCHAHRVSITERLKLFREVCAAVIYAHRRTVIHRDIKPSNILVTSEGVPKLLDFGIAKVLQAGDGGGALMTATGLRPMTPEYASPEQVRGEPVTTASDVYSLGVVFYELLTGRSPYAFTSRSPLDVERTITDTEPRRPSIAVTSNGNKQSRVRDGKLLRGDLDNIVLTALRKEPTRRYQSVEQFSEDIRRHLEARPVLARKDTIGYRAGKFVRRNTVATAAVALVFLSLLGGVIATTWQAHRANLAKARAERRFNDVRQLAHSVLFDYHDAIRNLPGATRVRERLVKDGLTYLDSLASEASGDPALQRELAAAYERVGDVRGQAYSANLGDSAGAIDSYQKALRIREALVAAAPGDMQKRRDLAAIHGKIGNQLADTSEAARGLEYLRKSLALYSELAAADPSNDGLRHDLAETYNATGLALEGRGDMAVALDHYRKALPIYEELLGASPQDHGNRRSFSAVHENIGRALFLSNDVKGALQHNQKALELREALVTEDPTNADYRRLLGVSYQDNGDYQAWIKDTKAALDSFRKKLTLDEHSVAADPANAQARGDLAYSCQRMGDLLAESGDYAQALPHYRRALEIYGKAAAGSQELGLPIRVVTTQACVAKTYAKLGDANQARSACRKAIELLQTTRDDPSDVSQRRLRVVIYGVLGDAYAVLAADKKSPSGLAPENWRAAGEMYRRSLDLMKDLQTRGILDAEEIPEIENTGRKIAECDKLSQ
jgi:eukaryotic-like serine/threonine-protein kinase